MRIGWRRNQVNRDTALETNRVHDYRRHAGSPGGCVPPAADAARARGRLILLRSAPAALAMMLAGSAPAAEVRADDTLNGRRIAATCASCHGTDGRSEGEIPALAGYPADRLVATLTDFKSGKRPATIMHQIAKGYTDAQIASAAAYFAAQRD